MPIPTIGAGRALLTSGIKGIILPGIAGNYASAPDSAALSIVGDITIDVKIALDDWTPAVAPVIASKVGAAGHRSYDFYVDATGKLNFRASADGTNFTYASVSTAATGILDGAPKWLRSSYQVNNGGGSHVVRFYLADDGAAWSQLGTTVSTAGTLATFDSDQILEIGSETTGTANPLAGKVYVINVYAANLGSSAGTPVFAVDFSTKQPGANTLRDSAGGALVTINGTQWRDSLT